MKRPSKPAIVALVVAAINTGDTAAFLDLFHDAATVDDRSALYRGRQQITAWSERALIGARVHVRLRASSQHGDLVTMLVDATTGHFTGRMQLHFVLRAGRILEMKITPWLQGDSTWKQRKSA